MSPPAVDGFFGPAGRLARTHPAFEHRPGQEQMAEAVARTLEQGGRLLVEAGTGTGKTLAYLVPALLSGRRVIVSTGTRNLQDQLRSQDLPFLAERAGFTFDACVIKGRDNYLCRYRLAAFEREPLLEDLDERDWLPRISAWSRTTESGDRAELADLPDDLRLWRDVNARADTCLGSRCPEYESCWLTRVKRGAQQARIVIVNHHLFFADLAVRTAFGSVLPDYDSVIFDEAHLLEEVATLYFGTQVSSAQVEELARQAEPGAAAGLRQAAADFFAPVRERLRGEPGRQRFDPPERGGPELDAEWAALRAALEDVARSAASRGEAPEEAEATARRADELTEDLARVLARRDPAFVYGLELRGRQSVLLSASPVDVSESLRERLFSGLHAAVLTSATLAVGQDAGFFARRLGIDGAEGQVVGSPFDHREQALLYLPRGLPEPRHPAFVERATAEIVRLLEASGGRAFLLFTSFANLRRVHESLAALDRWPLFVQGQGAKAALVDAFRATPAAVLLGTASFWHGVDVPGEALSLVVVDKLPFDVPSDPLVAARIERIRGSGGDPFREYQLPLAVLELKQGLGRLLRRTSDRGVVSVLDPRISTKAYGRVFREALPPYRVVRALVEVERFFAGGG